MKTLRHLALSALLLAAASLTFVGYKTEEHEHGAMQAGGGGSYPLTKCVVTGDDLGDKPYVFTHDGKTVKLCCKDCLAKFNEDPAKYMAKLNEAK